MRKASGFTLRRQKKTAAASTAREAFEEAPTTRSTLPSPEELNSQLQKRLTQELKGQLLDVEAKLNAYRAGVDEFLSGTAAFVAKLGGDAATREFVARFEALQKLRDEGEAEQKEENPIQRQARLESLTTAIREQRAVMEFLVSSTSSPSAYRMQTHDFVKHTPFLLVHLVLSWLDKRSIAALACTCRQWQKRCASFGETRARTDLLLAFVRQERAYAQDLKLGLGTFGRSMEKHGIVDKTVIFLNIPVFLTSSKLLLDQLYERISHWSPEQLVGDVFVRLASAFDMYLFFAARLDSSLKLVKSLQNRSQANKVISEISVRIGRDLPSFLTAPATHCTKMRDFLSAMLTLCPEEHADAPHLQRALEQMQSIVDELNKRHTVESILSTITNLPSRVKDTNTISVLREGAVTVSEKASRIFLCSGCIILADVIENDAGEASLIFSNMLDFKPTPPVVLSSVASELTFDLQTSKGSTAVSVSTSEERISWMQSIKTAIDAFLRKSSTLNVFQARKEPLLSQSSRSVSLNVSKRSQVSLHGATRIPDVSMSSSPSKGAGGKKMITLGRGAKNAFKGLRGLHKRAPLVDMAQEARLFQVFATRLIHHDVHPVSLAVDGAFLLETPSRIMCYCGPKLAPDSPQFSGCLALGSRLATPDCPMEVVDPNDEGWWAYFGGKFKTSEPTHRDYIDRYAAKMVVTVIHSDMRISEEGVEQLPELMQQPCHFILDVRDDVYMWVGHEAAVSNKPLALAKADELFEGEIHLRPQCASIVVVEQAGQPDVVFETLVTLINSKLPVTKPKTDPRGIGGSADAVETGSIFKKRTGSTSAAGAISPRGTKSSSVPEIDIQTPVPAPPIEKTPRQIAIQQNKAKLDSVFSMLDSAEVVDQTEISYSSDSDGSADAEASSDTSKSVKVALSLGEKDLDNGVAKDDDDDDDAVKDKALKSAMAWVFQDNEEDESAAVVDVADAERSGMDVNSGQSDDDVLDILEDAMRD